MKIDLQLKYGVVRARGTSSYNTGSHVVFQSDNAFEAMKELERLADQNEGEFTYMLIVNNDIGQDRRRRTKDRRTLQERREETRPAAETRPVVETRTSLETRRSSKERRTQDR